MFKETFLKLYNRKGEGGDGDHNFVWNRFQKSQLKIDDNTVKLLNKETHRKILRECLADSDVIEKLQKDSSIEDDFWKHLLFAVRDEGLQTRN